MSFSPKRSTGRSLAWLFFVATISAGTPAQSQGAPSADAAADASRALASPKDSSAAPAAAKPDPAVSPAAPAPAAKTGNGVKIDFAVKKPALPELPKGAGVDVDLSVSKPALPELPARMNVDLSVKKPALPEVPKGAGINVDLSVKKPEMPELPQAGSVKVDVGVKAPSLATPAAAEESKAPATAVAGKPVSAPVPAKTEAEAKPAPAPAAPAPAAAPVKAESPAPAPLAPTVPGGSDVFTKRTDDILKAERNSSGNDKQHPLALRYPDYDVVICQAGCDGAKVVDLVHRSRQKRVTETAEMVPSAATFGTQSSNAVSCIAGCYSTAESTRAVEKPMMLSPYAAAPAPVRVAPPLAVPAIAPPAAASVPAPAANASTAVKAPSVSATADALSGKWKAGDKPVEEATLAPAAEARKEKAVMGSGEWLTKINDERTPEEKAVVAEAKASVPAQPLAAAPAAGKSSQPPKVAEAPKPAETLKPAGMPKVAEAPKAAEVQKSVEPAKVAEAQRSSDVLKAAEAPKATEIPKAQAPKAAEAPKPAEAAKATEAPKATDAPKAEAPKAKEAPKSTEAPKAAEAPKATEAPKAEAPKVVEPVKVAEAPKVAEVPEAQKPVTGKSIAVSSDDPEMNAAIQKARGSLADFWGKFDNPGAGERGFALKVAVTDKGQTEHFWLTDVERKDGKLFGKINNAPEVVKNVKFGQRHEFAEDRISDWMFMRNGKMVGNETMRPLLSRMPPAEADGYRSMLETP